MMDRSVDEMAILDSIDHGRITIDVRQKDSIVAVELEAPDDIDELYLQTGIDREGFQGIALFAMTPHCADRTLFDA